MAHRLHRRRTGSILPLLALTIVGLLTLVALAIDLGMLAVARTQCQSAADTAALSGAR
ncbi:MAG: pilus assembly protein TadG-related protein, partial [Gemmataceae bacterium]